MATGTSAAVGFDDVRPYLSAYEEREHELLLAMAVDGGRECAAALGRFMTSMIDRYQLDVFAERCFGEEI